MSGDATVPPSPARVRRAHRAGMRPPIHSWLLAGMALALAWGAGPLFVQLGPWARSWWRAAFTGATPAVGVDVPLDALSSVAIAALLVTFAVGLLARNLAPVDRRAWEELGARPVGGAGVLAVPFALLAAGGVALLLSESLAGAARAPGASLAGLLALGSVWGTRAVVALGAAGLVLGWALRRVAAMRIRRALYQTVAEAREEARRSGGRRR